jgi:two-component system, chemotaxis family, chemotaxis protein CheY
MEDAPSPVIMLETATGIGPWPITPVAHLHEILLVDDHMVVRRALGEALTLSGYYVVDVGSGEEALSALRDGLSPCFIFLDPGMPHASARRFRAAQLADPELAEIPVAILSAMDVSPDIAGALWIDDWLVKPPEIEAMLRLVDSRCRNDVAFAGSPNRRQIRTM